MLSEREHQKKDAQDYIRSEVQRELRQYKRRLVDAIKADYDAQVDVVGGDGTLRHPVDVAREATHEAIAELAGGEAPVHSLNSPKPNLRPLPKTSGRVLDFDTECRPMHYSEWRPESQITAYAWSWVGSDVIETLTLRHHEEEDDFWEHERDLLETFMAEVARADVITGHYLLRHDLPLLTDHCMRLGLALPDPVLVADTKVHMPRVRALGLSQENLGDLLRIDEKKHHMSGRLWAEANNLTRQGRELAAKRVSDDVAMHLRVYEEATAAGWLKPTKLWRP